MCVRAEIRVSGIVQGVGFRPFIYRIAVKNRLLGYVRNRGDAGVEIAVEGGKREIERFLIELREKKPPLSQIYDLSCKFTAERNEFKSFTIVESIEGGDTAGSVIPPDVAICEECAKELRNPEDRRFSYFFITCTDCGPRYTVIEKLPYDRPNTTMRAFQFCRECEREYLYPKDRRFHAQTVACTKCGPRVFLTDGNGEEIASLDPIRETGRLIEEGKILAIKGYGGFHIASSTLLDDPILRLRKTKQREQKPFAIMTRDLEALRSFAIVSEAEERLLTSCTRPIVLLRKSDEYCLSKLISPGLHNTGVMLPYTALHMMLFDFAKEPAFIMTSANPPNEPIITENQQALDRLKDVVDYFLFHDRDIAQRCDDSVARVIKSSPSMIRRSRGYAPAPLHLKKAFKNCILGTGGELNVTSCLLLKDKAFVSQHIGDVEKLETMEFMKSATEHLMRLTNCSVEAVACDLNPRFNTTRYARELGEEFSCEVFPVQHHHAHLASLMGEHGIREIVGISCDGIGYGDDGNVWGGEILLCNSSGYKRLAHLEEQPMIGGDRATIYPLRMVAGMLRGQEVENWLLSRKEYFPHGEREIEVILKQLGKGSAIKTTSTGRVLDAVAALLGICYERTYEGEPAMKLESASIKGREVLHLQPKIEGNVLRTAHLLRGVFDGLGKYRADDLAYSAQNYLASGLGQLAIEKARELDIDVVGFSGGVAYNEFITTRMRALVEEAKLKFLTNVQVPPGDGGISFGQVFATGMLLEEK